LRLVEIWFQARKVRQYRLSPTGKAVQHSLAHQNKTPDVKKEKENFFDSIRQHCRPLAIVVLFER